MEEILSLKIIVNDALPTDVAYIVSDRIYDDKGKYIPNSIVKIKLS